MAGRVPTLGRWLRPLRFIPDEPIGDGRRPTTSQGHGPECRNRIDDAESDKARDISAYLWSGEPSSGRDPIRRGGPGQRPGSCGVSRSTSTPNGDAFGGILVGQAGGCLRSGGGSRCNLASVLVSVEVVAARCRVPGAYLRHARGGDMKPCGHDHRELTHLRRPHQWMGHADAASCPMACGPISRRVTGIYRRLKVPSSGHEPSAPVSRRRSRASSSAVSCSTVQDSSRARRRTSACESGVKPSSGWSRSRFVGNG